jgi:thioredoxin 1
MEIELTAESFDREVLESDVPVIVDFWAEWCVPCKMVAPVLSEIAEEYDGTLRVGRLDVDAHGEVAARYNIVSIPTILLFKNGEIADQHVGAAPKDTLVDFISPHLS